MIKILSLNLYNNKSSKNIDKLLDLLSCYDIIGTQEGTYKLDKIITSRLTGYKSYGKYRFSNYFKHFRYNENNKIITKLKVTNYDNYYLSIFGSIRKDNINIVRKFNLFSRIATVAIIKTDIGNICHINTHLSYGPDSIHERQLNDLLEIVDIHKRYNIVITGDLNIDIDHPEFIKFNDKLKEYGINRVNIKDYTFKDRHIDHIFVSNKLKVKKMGVIDNISDITDHNGVYVYIDK